MMHCFVGTASSVAALRSGRRVALVVLVACTAMGIPWAQHATPYAEFLLPGEVVRENVVRLAIPRVIGADTVLAAWFHVHCMALRSGSTHGILDTLIAFDTVPPFETLWNCSHLPDQDNSEMYFWCDVLTASGEVKGGRTSFRRPVALDRDTSGRGPLCKALRQRRAVVFDGALHEWSDRAPLRILAGDNRADIRIRWTERFLFVTAQVEDRQVLIAPQDSPADSASLKRYDAVEIYLDIRHERTSVRRDDDFRVCVTPDGRTVFSPNPGPQQYRPLVGCRHHSAGYSLEIGILWEAVGYAPYKGSKLGFNIAVVDRDSATTQTRVGDWAETGPLRLQNPNAWGTAKFVAGPPLWPWAAAVTLAAAACAIGVARRLRRRYDLTAILSTSPFMGVVARVLEEHYTDPDVNARTIAGAMHLSGPRLVRMIRRETGMDFRRFLNEFRISKAKTLLTTTDLPLTEIARQVGYQSPSVFTHFFERSVRMSPMRYRTLYRRAENSNERNSAGDTPAAESGSA